MLTLRPGHRRTGACPTFHRPTLARDGYLVRVPLVGGAVTPTQLRRVAAQAHGNGVIELTNRGNLQLRGVAEGDVSTVLADLEAVGFGSRDAALVTISPFAGTAEHAVRQTLVERLGQVLGDGPALSPKFVVHVDDVGGRTRGRRAEAVVAPEVGTGGVALIIDRLGRVEVSAEVAADIVAALAEACRSLSPDARLAEVEVGPGPAWLRSQLPVPPEAWSAPIDHPHHAEPGVGAVPLLNGRLGVLAGARFGRISPDQLAALAALVDARRLAAVRITPWRSVLATPTADTDGGVGADGCIDALAGLGFVTDPTDPAHEVITCVGAAGCWQCEVDTLAEARRIVEQRAGGRGPLGAVHVSGCDKRCASRSTSSLVRLGRADGTGFDTVTPP